MKVSIAMILLCVVMTSGYTSHVKRTKWQPPGSKDRPRPILRSMECRDLNGYCTTTDECPNEKDNLAPNNPDVCLHRGKHVCCRKGTVIKEEDTDDCSRGGAICLPSCKAKGMYVHLIRAGACPGNLQCCRGD